MRLAFIASGSVAADTRAYHEGLLAALAAVGHEARSLGDAAAFESLDAGTRILVDASALPALAGSAEKLVSRRAALLLARPAAHDAALGETERSIRASLEARLLPLFARVVVPNEAAAEELRADGLADAAHLSVLASGSTALPRSEGSGEAGPMLLSAGAPEAQEAVLRALSRMPDLRWRLVLACGNADAPAALAAGLGLADRLYATATLAESLWRQADLFVQADAWDSYGLTVAEALRRGVPVASSSGGAPQMLLADGGIACPPGDLVTLSKVLRRLLCDEALRAELTDAAWQAGQALPDWATQAAALVTLLGG